MKNKLATIFVLGAMALLSCCSSVKTASLGAGATAGKDYVTNLRPSAAARQYFDKIGNKAPMEMLTRANAARSKSGVRFVADDGILIPPGVTISFSNKGYCLDPKLPAPVADEEYQLVPTSALIPSKLQGIYQNLLRRAAAGDSTVKSNMQGLVWALRTAGVEGGYASRISDTQRRILDSCSTRPGEFERIHKSGLTTNKLVDELWKLADSAVHVDIAGRRWKPSDFSSAGSFNSAINSQLNSLISQGSKLPIQRTGFNYGELEPGIYTDVRGIGNLAFHAKIANTTNKDFIFYPSNYVGQVGSGSALSSSYTQRQRVSMGPVTEMCVVDIQESPKSSCGELVNNIKYVLDNFDNVSLGMNFAPTTEWTIALEDGECKVSMKYIGDPIIKINPNVIVKASKQMKIDGVCLINATLYHEYKHQKDMMKFKKYAPALVVFNDAIIDELINDMKKAPGYKKDLENILIDYYNKFLEKHYEMTIVYEKRAMIEEEKSMYKGWILSKRGNSQDAPIKGPISKHVQIVEKSYLAAWNDACNDSSGFTYSDLYLEKLMKEREALIRKIGKLYLETTGKTEKTKRASW